jgi:hypothetical protein
MDAPDPALIPKSVATLPYGARARWPRRHGVRSVLAASIVFAILAGAYAYHRYRPAITVRLALMSFHDACMNYTIQDGLVVYRETWDPDNPIRVWNGPALVSTRPPAGMRMIVAAPRMYEWLEPAFIYGRPVVGPWGKPGVFLGRGSGVLFLHGRSSARGQRLVCVELNRSRQRSDISVTRRPEAWTFRTRVIRQASLFSAGELLSEKADQLPNWPDPPFGLCIFGGQPDPQDDSHFTITFAPGSTFTGMIDGRLMPDDTVVLKVQPPTAP